MSHDGSIARWNHSSLAVNDLNLAVGFYTAAFGFEVLFSEDLVDEIELMTGSPGMRCRLAQLRVPGAGQTLELIEFRSPGSQALLPTGVGHGHVAFGVDDVPGWLQRLEELGARPLGSVASFDEGRAVYLQEPAGSVVELTEIDPEAVE